ncbi:MAG: sigma-70 family RNA polymerase sigma factor [Thermoguttaceae bacterium]
MATHHSKLARLPAREDRFATTHWSLVVRAGAGRSPEARRSLAILCENYWFPLYVFVRRSGRSAQDAQDLTQEFFVRLLDKHFLAAADANKGRFRTFLITAIKHFMANQYDRLRAQKRGGLQQFVSLDALDGFENRYGRELADTRTPERIFEQQWALTMLSQVLTRLQTEMAARGKAALFDALKGHLTGGQAVGYATTAGKLGMTEGAVRVAAHRLRQRYRELLRDEIAQTVASSEDVEEEIRYLFTCL